MLSHLLEYCLFLMRRTRCRLVSRMKFVWRWYSRFFGSRFPGFSEDELCRTLDGILCGLPLRQIQEAG